MARDKRKKTATQKDICEDDSYALIARRSSMRVNLSFVSNLSDSGHSSLKGTTIEGDGTISEEPSVQSNDPLNMVKKCKTKRLDVNNDSATPASVGNVTVISGANCFFPNNSKVSEEVQSNSLTVIKEKEQQLNRSCMQLKDAIMNKTQALFDKENELAIKTTEVLAAGYVSLVHNDNDIDELHDKRSPSVRVNIGKNEQIVMSGDGRKRNPVQVNSMLKQCSLESENNVSSDKTDEEDVDCNQSIVSTPKKMRTDSNSGKKNSHNKTPETVLRIPVARLFADNDPNNSMSELNPAHRIMNSSKETDTDQEANKNDTNNISRLSNELNYSTSPILSQGHRVSRLSRLSLKKKLTKNPIQTSSRLSSCTVNESFLNKAPLTCSSFIEKQDKTNNKDEISKHCKTIDLAEKSDSDNNCKTINLDGNEDNSKTIEITNSANLSCMEITTISSHMPIIHRSFQQINKSIKVDNITVAHEGIQRSIISTQRQAPSNTNQNKDSNKAGNALESTEQAHSNGICQEDCSINTVRTSLNVNTSLDQINSADHIVQKENQTPNNVQETANKDDVNQVEKEDDTILIQRQSTCTIRSSMQVNTSLDSIKRSSVSSTVNKFQGTNNRLTSRQSSSSTATTVRSSMQVNTSLDSVRKSPKNVLDFNKILSMVAETSVNDDQSRASVYTSKEQSSDSDSELENVSLMERIRNISATKRAQNCKEPNEAVVSTTRKSIETKNKSTDTTTKSTEIKNKSTDTTTKSTEIKNKSTNATRKSTEIENTTCATSKASEHENINSSTTRKSTRLENNTSNTTRKSAAVENISSTFTDSSIVETTPYPISRSVLLKTMIKNNIAMNTLDPRRFEHFSDDEDSNSEFETMIQKKTAPSPNKYKSVYARKKTPSPNLMDTVILNTSDESSNESDKEREPVIIEESLNQTNLCNKSRNDQESDDEENSKKVIIKRKLYPVRDNSDLVSFSPAEDIQGQPDEEAKDTTIKKRRRRKLTQKKKQENKEVVKSPEAANETELLENEILPKTEKTKKKPRRIISKKIVVKKVTNARLLDYMMNDEKKLSQRLSDRNSLREFDLRRVKCRKENSRKSHKIIIVVTGLSREDRDLVKSVIKTLGSATMDVNVTPRTTHVISSGVRTVNLVKGIIRGCWLLSLEWALKSLESEKWLDPSPFEMSHFSKAVQENRRDRQLFGKAYVPELFVTCGFIYIENGTSPPAPTLKELVKIAGGRITEDPDQAEIVIGSEGLKEIWILDSITTGEVQSIDQYKRN